MYSQSLFKQLSESHIPIHHSKHQVIVNPHNGKRERVFVDLSAIYPTPEEPGTELSFEEIWAANRGWLDRAWDDDEAVEQDYIAQDENNPLEVDLLADSLSEKLVVHSDVVMLDENGAPILPREGKVKKKKVTEINETQISECYMSLTRRCSS